MKKITEVEKTESYSESGTLYVEVNGEFRRATVAQVKDAMQLGGITVQNGMFCVTYEGGEDE